MPRVRPLRFLFFSIALICQAAAEASQMPPLESGPVPSEYVVVFSRHLSPLQRHSLLHPCMPSPDIWKLSRRNFFRQSDLVSSDLAAIVFSSSIHPRAESAAIACVKDLPGVKFVQQQRWYRRAVSVMSNISLPAAPVSARKLHSIVPSRVLAAKELWDKVPVFARLILVCLVVTL